MDLSVPELWLLARLGERPPLTEAELCVQVRADPAHIVAALERLRGRRLAEDAEGGRIALTAAGREQYERIVAAKCEALRELVGGWTPDRDPEVRRLIERLARDLVPEMPGPARAVSDDGGESARPEG